MLQDFETPDDAKIDGATNIENDTDKQQNLIKQEDALQHYLQALLRGTSDKPISETQTVLESEPQQVEDPAPATLEDNIAKQAPVNNKNLPPAWALGDKPYLAIEVSGFSLLIPRCFIASITQINLPLENDAMMPTWIYSMRDLNDNPIRLINTAKLIFSAANFKQTRIDKQKYILCMSSGDWGISCSKVHNVMKINLDDVNWRGDSPRRRWLAGTSIKLSAAILDMDYIKQSLIN